MKNNLNTLAAVILIIMTVTLPGCNKTDVNPLKPWSGGSLRFVYLADSRGDSPDHLVNEAVLSTIVRHIAKLTPKPSFVVFGGDMSNRGYSHASYTYEAWKELLAPLADSGITLYAGIGNHELYRDPTNTLFWLANQQEYQRAFSGNPRNGPAGYEYLVYSFTDSATNSFFAMLDPYFLNRDSVTMNLGGNIDATQMSWLKAQVSRSGATHKFLFNHAPYYYVSNDPVEPSEANKSYTELWAYIDANKFDMYLCGHQHLYSRKTIDKEIPADPVVSPPTAPWQNNVVQLLTGTCGAFVSTEKIHPGIRNTWHVFNSAATYYFSVIDITGRTVKVTSYLGDTGEYRVCDTCTITR